MRPHWRKGIERNLNPSSKLRERKTGYLAGMLGADPAHHLDQNKIAVTLGFMRGCGGFLFSKAGPKKMKANA